MENNIDIIDEINRLPRFRKYTCHQCGHEQEVYTLEIYGICKSCGRKSKLRGFASMGTEIEDVIDAVLQWLGTDKEFEHAMKSKKEINNFIEGEKPQGAFALAELPGGPSCTEITY